MTHMTLQAVRQLIANDSYAITFQSLGQYRTALLRHFDSLVEAPITTPAEEQRAAFEAWHHRHFSVAAHRAQAKHGGNQLGLEYWSDYTNNSWAGWQAALAAQSQGAQATPAGLTRYSMWSNSTACGMDPSASGDWVSFDEVRDLLGAQEAAAPDAMTAFRKWHEVVGDQDCEYTWMQAWTAARLSMSASAPGTPEAPKGVA